MTNVEIKTGVYYYEDIEEKTLELIRKYHLEDRVMFSSFNHLSLERMKELAPDIPREPCWSMRAWEMRDTTAAVSVMTLPSGNQGDLQKIP